MAHTDTISDLLVRISTAGHARLEQVVLPNSKLIASIVTALERHGYVEVLPKKGKKAHRQIEINLRYDGKTPRVKGVCRISKSSKRVYYKSKNIMPVKSGYGSLILSTPKGILTDTEARKENVGGEALFQIW